MRMRTTTVTTPKLRVVVELSPALGYFWVGSGPRPDQLVQLQLPFEVTDVNDEETGRTTHTR